MNEELQTALSEILSGALSTANDAKDFIMAELPDVLQQLLWWKFAESIIYCLVGVALLSTIPLFWWLVIKKGWIDEDPVLPIGFVLSIFCLVTGLINVNLNWLQIWIAPKVYLIEYAANLVK